MGVNGWFPRFNLRGEIISGNTEIYFGETFQCAGGFADWIDPDTIVFGRDSRTVIRNVRSGTEAILPVEYNTRRGGGGEWWGHRITNGVPLAHRYSGVNLIGAVPNPADQNPVLPIAPVSSKLGTYVAFAAPYQEEYRLLYLNGQIVARGRIMSVSVSEEALVWLVATGTYTREVYGFHHDDKTNVMRINLFDWEDPLVFDTPTGPWVLSTTQWGTIARPFGEIVGHQWIGDMFNPDAICVNEKIMIVASSNRGEQRIVQVGLRDQLHIINPPPPVVVEPPKKPEEPPIIIIPKPTEPPHPPAGGGGGTPSGEKELDDMAVIAEDKFEAWLDEAARIIVKFRKDTRPNAMIEGKQSAREMADRYRTKGKNPTLGDLVWGSFLREGSKPLDAARDLDPMCAEIIESQERLRR